MIINLLQIILILIISLFFLLLDVHNTQCFIHYGLHLRHIIFNLSQPVFALIPVSCALSGEAANTNFIVLCLTRLGIEPTIYRKASMLTITPMMWFLWTEMDYFFSEYHHQNWISIDNLDIFMSDMLQKYCSKMQGNLHLAFDEKTNLKLSRRLLHHNHPAAWADCTKRITKSKVQYLTG